MARRRTAHCSLNMPAEGGQGCSAYHIEAIEAGTEAARTAIRSPSNATRSQLSNERRALTRKRHLPMPISPLPVILLACSQLRFNRLQSANAQWR
jgi:hypothetical protein